MKRHTQSILACPKRNDGHDAAGNPGDCFRTAIACILELEPADVPHFATSGEEWWNATQSWMQGRGDALHYLPLPIPADWRAWWGQYRETVDYVILGGPSPRGPFDHVVIGTPDLEIVHDPHPSQAGLSKVVEVFAYVKGGAQVVAA